MGQRKRWNDRPRRNTQPALPMCEVDQSCYNRSKVAFTGMTYGGQESWSEPVTVFSCLDHATGWESRHPEMQRRDVGVAAA